MKKSGFGWIWVNWFHFFLLLGLGTTLFTGCIPSSPPPKPPPPPSRTDPKRITPTPSPVTLVLGNWRPDDAYQMNAILERFHTLYPHIFIKYDPTSSSDYDAAIRAQLASGTGPDLLYLRSYSVSQSLFKSGYLELLDSYLSDLKDHYQPRTLAPWATENGSVYGVPFLASAHGIYYNQSLFSKANVTPPQTWEELLSAAQKLKSAGIIPFANASGDPWTVAEILLMNLAPNFIGGQQGRLEYLQGKRCFNDANVVAAFQAIRDLSPYLPANQRELKYNDSQQLFIQGQAAMLFSGSWEIALFESENLDFDWNIMPVPPPAGKPGFMTFHPDIGIGLNSASKHKEEALLFLKWMETDEFLKLAGDQLPGLYPLHDPPPQVSNLHARAFLMVRRSEESDIRFAWEKLRDGTPDGYTLMMDGAVSVLNGITTPQQAANALQEGLAAWFIPAQKCQK